MRLGLRRCKLGNHGSHGGILVLADRKVARCRTVEYIDVQLLAALDDLGDGELATAQKKSKSKAIESVMNRHHPSIVSRLAD